MRTRWAVSGSLQRKSVCVNMDATSVTTAESNQSSLSEVMSSTENATIKWTCGKM